MEFINKPAYIKGLIEGMNLDSSKEETKIFKAMVDLLQDLSTELKELKNECSENKELLYELDEDLGEVEKAVFEGCDHDSSECKANGCGCNCDDKGDNNFREGDYCEHDEYVNEKKSDCSDCNEDEEDDDDIVEEKYEVLCPKCRHIIYLENANLEGDEIVCPQCGKELELDFDDDNSEEKTIDY